MNNILKEDIMNAQQCVNQKDPDDQDQDAADKVNLVTLRLLFC